MTKKKHIARPLPESLALPFTGMDSHAHLDIENLLPELPALLRRAALAGVAHVGQVFLSPEACTAHRPAFEACTGPDMPAVFFILGIHPCDAMNLTGHTLDAMRTLFADDARLRAVGEIGLDFYWKDCAPFVQEEAFRLQLALARSVQRPVVIHSRDAAARTLEILEAENFAGYPLLWHCFSGEAIALTERILANGWHISVPGPVSYNANADMREALTCIPADRLLLETDTPYLAPEPWRGKRNEPAFTAFTAHAVSVALGRDPAELWTTCGENGRRFFGV